VIKPINHILFENVFLSSLSVIPDYCYGNAHTVILSLLMSRSKAVTYELTPWSTDFLEGLIVAPLVKKFPSFYGT